MGALQESIPKSVRWEVVVAENGSRDNTCEAVREMSASIPLVLLHLREKGKAAALNEAMALAKGQFVIFTDDDIIPSQTWVSDLLDAAGHFPEAILFTGPIIPAYPKGTPNWLQKHPLCGFLFARYQPPNPLGYISPFRAPYGPNFAVRRSAIANLQFRVDLGPSEQNGPLSYEDWDFIEELRHRHSAFLNRGGFIFVPSASVCHEIRREQTGLDWITERAYQSGRSSVIMTGKLTSIRPCSLLQTRDVELPPANKLSVAVELNYYIGALSQLRRRGDNARASDLWSYLVTSPFVRKVEYLSKSARLALGEDLR